MATHRSFTRPRPSHPWLGARRLEMTFGHFQNSRLALLLAKDAEDVFGCVAVRALGREMCELKRLYVREDHRDLGLGLRLSKLVINRAKTLGYRFIRLDTLPPMIAAQGLYRRLGFVEIDAYYHSPIAGTVFMELELSVDESGGRG